MTSSIFLHYYIFHFISILYQTNAFSITMHPLDSPHLKLVPESLTKEERYQLLVNILLARSFPFHKKSAKYGHNSIEYPLSQIPDSFFLAQLHFGNRDPEFAPLAIVDMTGDQTWFQCEPCKPCFDLRDHLMVENSTTFQRMVSHDPRCNMKTKFEGSCGFDAYYGEGHASGYMATDTFNFDDAKGGRTFFPNIAFGCGINNQGFDFNNKIAGVHGFGLGPRSFLTQLSSEIKGRFSYCIPRGHGKTTILFGDAAQLNGPVETFAMNPHAHYHLYLDSITLSGEEDIPVKASVGQFKLDTKTYKTGFFLDPGVPITKLNTLVRLEIITLLTGFYALHKMIPIPDPFSEGVTCFTPADPRNVELVLTIPRLDIVLHFSKSPNGGGGKVALTLEGVVETTIVPPWACYKILETSGPSIFGAQQQAGLGLLFDVEAQQLSIAKNYC